MPLMSRRWWLVAFLILLYCVSMLDRLILSLLAVEVSREFGLSNSEIALLIGASFAIFYSLGGLPLAHLIDHRNRCVIVTICAGLWSVMTALSAFATSYEMLILCRIGVALGEAALGPAAISLIADLFPRNQRTIPTAAYNSVGSVMNTGAFVVGAAIWNASTGWSGSVGLDPWRLTLLMIGVPGIFLALLFFLTTKEPTRVVQANDVEVGGWRDLTRYLATNRVFYGGFYIGTSLSAMMMISLVIWLPTLLERNHGMGTASAGFWIGAVGMPVGLASIFFWPWLSQRMERGGRQNALARCLVMSTALGVPFYLLAPLMSSAATVLICSGIALFGFSALGVLPALTIQTLGPARARARLIAVYYLAANIAGYAAGPQLIGLFGDLWKGDPMGIAYGMAITGGVGGLIAIQALVVAARRSIPPAP